MANFTGTDADEIIIPGFVSPTVTTSGGSRPSNAADVINAGGGDDVIDSSGGNDVVTGGRGNDVAILGSGDDTFIWNPLDGSDTVEGQRGFDTLLFNGSNANENIEIAANGGRTTLFRDVGNVTMDLAGIEPAGAQALGGADTVVVNDLSGTAVKQVAIDLSSAGRRRQPAGHRDRQRRAGQQSRHRRRKRRVGDRQRTARSGDHRRGRSGERLASHRRPCQQRHRGARPRSPPARSA